MLMRTTALVASIAVAAVSTVGCSRADRAPRHEPAVAALPTLTDATQHGLAREVEQAERRGTWSEVRQRWQGQRVTWTVTRQRALCASNAACFVAAFPIQRPAQQGWLPQLQLSAGEFAKLDARCAGSEACEVRFEGTLRELALSADLPTSVRFADVRVL